MKRFAGFLAATTLGVTGATAALAGGPATPVEEPVIVTPAPVVMAPSGDWGGFYGGAQLGYADIDTNVDGLDGNGAIGGVHAGYRWDLGQTVLGVEADYDAADIDLADGAGSLDSVARLKFSAGYDLGANLIYATAGPAWADISAGGEDLSDNGYFFGAGYERQLTDQWSVGGEVLHHKFDDFEVDGFDAEATSVTARVNYRF